MTPVTAATIATLASSPLDQRPMDGLSQLRAIGSRLLTNANRSGRAPGSAHVCVHANGLVVQHQRRFAEAEQYHRQALDIKLRFDDRDSVATN